jgi:hypothetical protein
VTARHNDIYRPIGVEHERSEHLGAGKVEENIGRDREGEQPTAGTDGSQHRGP